MTKGERSSRAARERLKEYKPLVPTGRYDETGRPIMERKGFYFERSDDRRVEAANRAQAVASARAYSLALGRPPSANDGLTPGTIAWWLSARYSPTKSHLRPKSREAIQLAGEHLCAHLGAVQASRVGAAEITSALARIGQSASLRNKVRNLALDVMELAAEESPGVRPVARKRVPRAKEAAPRIEVLTPREARSLVESLSPHYRPAAYLMAFLGLRSGEAIAVLGGDLTPLGTLSVKRQDDGEGGWTHDLKTEESRRELPIPKGLYPLLTSHRAAATVPISRTRDKEGANGKTVHGTQISEDVLRKAVAAARKRLGLPPCPGHTLHALRHGASTWLASNGCPDSIRKAILGQSRAAVGDRYVHASPAAMLPYVDAMWAASEGAESRMPERKGGARVPATGERNGRAKISDADRARIVERLAEEGATVKGVARALGVSPKAIRNARASASRVVAATTSAEAVSPV